MHSDSPSTRRMSISPRDSLSAHRFLYVARDGLCRQLAYGCPGLSASNFPEECAITVQGLTYTDRDIFFDMTNPRERATV